MERILVIVESPVKVKTIRQFLPSNYIVMASKGHIADIKDGGGYFNTGIDVNKNFEAKYVVDDDKKDIVKDLKEQVKLADKVFLCSDPDREGEAIAQSLKEILGIPAKKCFRATFHEITQNAVLKALENPRKVDEDLVKAARARAKWDKIVGYSVSKVVKNEFDAKSAGRCQSAALELIYHREKSIQDFRPVVYGDIYLKFNKEGTEFKAKYWGTDGKEVKQPSLDQCKKIIEECKGKPFTVTTIISKDKRSYPQPPFTTSTFQQEVSSKLGFGVKKISNIAQRLFEGIDLNGKHVALITYIRTDSPEYAPEFIPILKDKVLSTYGKEYYAPLRPVEKSETAQDGHEAIRPVDLEMTPDIVAEKLTDDTLVKVYEIIYRRTMATMMAPAITSETTYVIECGPHEFHLVSRELTFEGYKKVYNYKDKDEEDVSLETLQKGYEISKYDMSLEEKQTKPPARYKEGTLVKELESSGIGRPSTFTSIVDTVLSESRGYCVTKDNCIVPTEKGMRVAKFLEDNEIITVDDTSAMEEELDDIAKGKGNDLEFLQNSLNMLEDSIADFDPTPKCPICGARMKPRIGPYGPFLGCTRYPECKGVRKINTNKEVRK